MGLCMSASSEEAEMKKVSQKIDKELEEDSKRLRRECKILLLGKLSAIRLFVALRFLHSSMAALSFANTFRLQALARAASRPS